MGVKHEASKGSASKAALAREVWRSLFDFTMATRSERDELLARRGLTPNDLNVLFTLEVDGLAMNELATAWNCEASNATWIVDRLEKLGLVERRAHPTDRRMKLVGLTAEGAKTKASLEVEYYRPPRELVALSGHDLEVLVASLRKLRHFGDVEG